MFHIAGIARALDLALDIYYISTYTLYIYVYICMFHIAGIARALDLALDIYYISTYTLYIYAYICMFHIAGIARALDLALDRVEKQAAHNNVTLWHRTAHKCTLLVVSVREHARAQVRVMGWL